MHLKWQHVVTAMDLSDSNPDFVSSFSVVKSFARIFATRVRSAMGGYVFTGVCPFTGGGQVHGQVTGQVPGLDRTGCTPYTGQGYPFAQDKEYLPYKG